MLATLHLTAEEKKLFNQLPKELKEGWEVEEETGTAYETPEAIRMRMQMADFGKYPEVEELLERVKAEDDIRKVDLGGVEKGVLRELAFAMGARGLSVLIRGVLRGAKTDRDIEGLVGLALLRREMLDVNASISHV